MKGTARQNGICGRNLLLLKNWAWRRTWLVQGRGTVTAEIKGEMAWFVGWGKREADVTGEE